MRRAIPLLLLLATACTQRSTVPDAERQRIAQELEGARRFFGVAVNVGPFFGDSSLRLASERPFGSECRSVVGYADRLLRDHGERPGVTVALGRVHR